MEPGLHGGDRHRDQARFHWAAEGDRIEKSPLKGLKNPAADHRETTITAEDFANILLKIRKDSFRDLLTFVWLRGCRAQEASAIETKWIRHDQKIVIFPVNRFKGKKLARVI